MKTLLWILGHVMFALLVIPGLIVGFIIAPFLHGVGSGRLAYLAMLIGTRIIRLPEFDEKDGATDEDERKQP